MGLHRYVETNDTTGEARIPGVTFEGRKVRVHERIKRAKGGDILVLWVSGGTCWAALGERDYVPAQFMIFNIVGPSDRRTRRTEPGWQEWETGDMWIEFNVRAGASKRKL